MTQEKLDRLNKRIELTQQRLRALYKQRRELRETMKPSKLDRPKQVFQLVRSGRTLEQIATELDRSLIWIKDCLYEAIKNRAADQLEPRGSLTFDQYWEKTWPARYKAAVKINARLPAGCRFSPRKFWPWRIPEHDGKRWDDESWFAK